MPTDCATALLCAWVHLSAHSEVSGMLLCRVLEVDRLQLRGTAVAARHVVRFGEVVYPGAQAQTTVGRYQAPNQFFSTEVVQRSLAPFFVIASFGAALVTASCRALLLCCRVVAASMV